MKGMPRHVIESISYRDERIECSCGAVVTAARDGGAPDRHGPLTRAWDAHRREVRVDVPAGDRRP
ncbi:MAG: hypothetical protein L0227_11000 [Chloroflexi bacterium]|nr:hypothetical protein [Chloroflexota bacterium]